MPAGRLIWPLIEPVLDAEGIVVSGATLTVYQNRTTDLAPNIYADRAMTTPIANPQEGAFACNSAGRFFAQTKTIWAPHDVLYSLKLTRPDGTFDQIDDIAPIIGPVSNFAATLLLAETAAEARTILAAASQASVDLINNRRFYLDLYCALDGVTDDVLGIEDAINDVVAAGGGTIDIPMGELNIESTIDFRPLINVPWRLEGAGRGVSKLMIRHDAGDWIKIGDTTQTRSVVQPTLSGFSLINDNGALTQGYAFSLEFFTDLTISDVAVIQPYKGFKMGTTSRNDCAYRCYLRGVYCQEGSHGANEFFTLNSGSILNIDSTCFFNGASGTATLFYQPVGTTRNYDGLYLEGFVAEQWGRFLSVEGQGISNLHMSGGQSDRPNDIAIYLQHATSDGKSKNWKITDWVFQGNEPTCDTNELRCIVFDPEGELFDINVFGCHFFGYGGNGIEVGHINLESFGFCDNTFRNVAVNLSVADAIFKINKGGGIVDGNRAWTKDVPGGPAGLFSQRMFEWVGTPSTGWTREVGLNVAVNTANADTGTP